MGARSSPATRRTPARHVLAAVLALAGHCATVIGCPLPSNPTSDRAESRPTTLHKKRSCCCASEGTCAGSCCCSGHAVPAADDRPAPPAHRPTPAPVGEHSWHWMPGAQALKCQGHGPAGLADLPPSLPASRPLPWLCGVPALDLAPVCDELALARLASPPVPPPRSR